jgi:transposase
VRSVSLWLRMLGLQQCVIESVDFDEDEDEIVVSVRRRKRLGLRCPHCDRRCARYDRAGVRRRWRALDLGEVRAFIEAESPRVRCPEHGVVVAAVPWARHDAGHTRNFDQVAAWLARYTSKSAVERLLRIAWRTVGRIVTRVMADADAQCGDRLAGVRRIGIDEISYRRGHKYLLVVVDHDSGRLLWIGEGRTKQTLAEFFNALGEDRCRAIELVSADGADWIADVVGLRCPAAKLCMDPFHVVQWANDALDLVRREVVRQARGGDKTLAKGLKGSRWALLKAPEHLTRGQRLTVAWIAEANRPLYRAYLLKEQLRAVFAAGGAERIALLKAWLSWAFRCRIGPFVDLARRIRRYYHDIANSLTYQLSNARVEAVNTKIRLLTRIAFGFHHHHALMALAMLHLGGYDIALPGRRRPRR